MDDNPTGFQAIQFSILDRIGLHPTLLIFCSVFLLVGVPGNILVLFVYIKRININICGFFIKTLAVLDLINSIAISPAFLVSKLFPDLNPSLLCKFITFIHYFNPIVTGFLYVAIAVQRYKKICHPQGHQMTKIFAQRFTVFCSSFAAITGIPVLFIMTNNDFRVKVQLRNGTEMIKVPTCDFTEEAKEMNLSLAFSIWLFIALVSFVSSLVVLYTLIGRHIRHHNQQHGLSSASVYQSRQTLTKMFFVLAVFFMLTTVPRIGLAIFFHKTKNLPFMRPSHLHAFDIIILLPYLNCVINPFVYSFCSVRFLEEIKSIFCARNRQQQQTSDTSGGEIATTST